MFRNCLLTPRHHLGLALARSRPQGWPAAGSTWTVVCLDMAEELSIVAKHCYSDTCLPSPSIRPPAPAAVPNPSPSPTSCNARFSLSTFMHKTLPVVSGVAHVPSPSHDEPVEPCLVPVPTAGFSNVVLC
ncbi:hypothetical protein ACJQWK_09867 [Exserohilum turcicum]